VYRDKYLVNNNHNNNNNNNWEQNKENQETNLIFSPSADQEKQRLAHLSTILKLTSFPNNFKAKKFVYVALLLGKKCHTNKAARKEGKVG
jgi:hypothetical protein